MISKVILGFGLTLALVWAAAAQLAGTSTIGVDIGRRKFPIAGYSSGGSAPGACSNKLDFSVSCNSQYVPAILY